MRFRRCGRCGRHQDCGQNPSEPCMGQDPPHQPGPKRPARILSGSARNLRGPGGSRHFGNIGSGTDPQPGHPPNRHPNPSGAQNRRTATHPRCDCPQNTTRAPRCPSRRTRSGRRRLRDDGRITGENHCRKPTARSPNSKKPSTPVLGSTRTPLYTSPSPDSVLCPGARALDKCSETTPTVTPAPSVTPQLRRNVAHHHRVGTVDTPSLHVTSEKRRLYDALDQ